MLISVIIKEISKLYMDKKDLKIVFMGTPDFAVESLKALIENGFNIVGVITAPDRPAGRGRKLKASPVKEYALTQNLLVLQPVKLKEPEFLEELSALKADLQIVVAFRMLPDVVWQMPRLGTYNLHGSLLPQYRGAAPINWAVINGEKESGVTTFFIDKEIDTGRIMFHEKVPISDDMSVGELHDILMEIGSKLVVKTTDAILNDKVEAIPQEQFYSDESELKPAPKIFKDDCKIDWSKDIDTVYNLIRGLSPYPAAFSVLKGEGLADAPVKIYKVKKVKSAELLEPGSVVSDNKTFIRVFCKDGALDILELQLAGKKRMDVEALLRGFDIDGKTFQ